MLQQSDSTAVHSSPESGLQTAQEPLRVIAVTGRARAGKDSVARVLASEEGFFRIGLADGVRAAFSDLNGPTWELLKELEAASLTSRWALQRLGTEARKIAKADEHWIDHLLVKIAYLNQIGPVRRSRFVIPDLRFPYEHALIADTIEQWGGRYELWKVERPGLEPIKESAHSSETFVDKLIPDKRVVNDGSLEDLRGKVLALVG